jgi:hypothetical protein
MASCSTVGETAGCLAADKKKKWRCCLLFECDVFVIWILVLMLNSGCLKQVISQRIKKMDRE